MEIMPEQEIRNFLSDICSRAAGFEIEATIASSHEIYLRFAVGRIHQTLDDQQTFFNPSAC